RPATRVAIAAVRRGLELAREGVGAEQITSKGGRDLVTATDTAVEDEIRRIVEDATPHPVVGEERGGDAPANGAPYWLLDPICGTRNFASGIPLYCVNLALVEGDRISLAVVGDPSIGEIHVAEEGRGAWATRDDVRRRLTTSGENQTIVVEPALAAGPRREHAARFAGEAIRADRWDMRNLSTTLSLAYVAAGRVAAYVLFSGSSLHTGAGTLLVSEAGGSVSDIEGAPWTVRSDSLIASANPPLHRELLDMVRATARGAG
ncbi:MAG TPA: inositol monophosphatase, partial [Actinomycetota bacterium]|nr:inositol monophosphatase [Actinomycetota bacterium]